MGDALSASSRAVQILLSEPRIPLGRQRLDPRARAGTSLAAGGLQEAQRLVPQLALAERVQVVHDVPALGRLRSPSENIRTLANSAGVWAGLLKAKVRLSNHSAMVAPGSCAASEASQGIKCSCWGGPGELHATCFTPHIP